MRVAELIKRTGVPGPTLKFYLRDGILHPGRSTARNQAEYDESHVRRVYVIHALTHVAGLPIKVARRVLNAIDHDTAGTALRAASPDGHSQSQLYEFADILPGYGALASPATRLAADAIEALQALGIGALLEHLEEYVAIARRMVEIETKVAEGVPERTEATVVTALMGDALTVALRHLARAEAIR